MLDFSMGYDIGFDISQMLIESPEEIVKELASITPVESDLIDIF